MLESAAVVIEPEAIVEIVVSGNAKVSKKAFDAECTKCHKHFKTKGAYEKHIGQQLCYDKNELSYCKTCNITLDTHCGYIKHLMTVQHLECIGAGKLERLKDDRPGVIHTADPYLSSNEAELLGTRNLGEKYTLVFENNEIQEVKLVRKPSPPITHQQVPIKVSPSVSPNSGVLVNSVLPNTGVLVNSVLPNTGVLVNSVLPNTGVLVNSVLPNTGVLVNNIPEHVPIVVELAAPDRITQPTIKQLEIMQYLERQQNPIEANNSFIKVLTTKLELEDYYGLSTLIRDNGNISLEVKKIILGLINKFVEGLTKKRVGGQTTYNNKDIAKVVVALSM
jgi:hypothetical protein